MDPSKIALVQSSFRMVAPASQTAASLFYAKLFEIAPEVEDLFTGDMEAQGEKLMKTLGAVVNGLDQFDNLLPVAGELARRHAGYGVRPEHYMPVGTALIATLKTALGEKFTTEHEEAWMEAYTALAAAMISAAYGPSAWKAA